MKILLFLKTGNSFTGRTMRVTPGAQMLKIQQAGIT